MIGGYAGGVPKGLAALPWPDSVRSLRMIELRSMSDINPNLLSLLNVKYVVVTTPDLYFDTASENSDQARWISIPGDPTHSGEVVHIEGRSFGLIQNSIAPLPRHFLVEAVTGVQETPSMRGAALEIRTRSAGESQDGASVFVRERIDRLTAHSLAEGFGGAELFDASGSLDVAYRADFIDIRVMPSSRHRFVVITERYDPNWHARTAESEIPIFSTNAIMMGVRIPPNVDRIELRFEPFSSTRPARTLMLLALLAFLTAIAAFWLERRCMRRRNP
jgi:hypothetical protein